MRSSATKTCWGLGVASATSGALLLGCTFLACSSEGNLPVTAPAGSAATTPSTTVTPPAPLTPDAGSRDAGLDYTTDFVPGDPSFVRSPTLDVTNISKSGERRSHNAGRNCLTCHQSQGPGRGQFVLAGTLYGEDGAPFPNAKLKLFARAEGPDGGRPGFGQPANLLGEVRTIDVDAKGNFFTTEPLPEPYPTKAIYPQFYAADGVTVLRRTDRDSPAQMSAGVTLGGCNYCHSSSFTITARP